MIAGFDQEALARAGNYGENDLQVTLAAFAALRATYVAELTALQPVQWERTGHHVTNGAVTILNHALHSVWHDTIHLAQIMVIIQFVNEMLFCRLSALATNNSLANCGYRQFPIYTKSALRA